MREPVETQRGVFTDITVELLCVTGNFLLFTLPGESATLSAQASFTSYAMSGTAPFILNADDADPAEPATLLLQGGGAQS